MGRNDDKTEQPTPKRKREARRKGQVARSQDLSGWVIALVGSTLLPVLLRSANTRLDALFAQVADVLSHPAAPAALLVLQRGLGDVVALVLPMVGVFAAVGVVVSVAQTGLVFSLHAAGPKWDHLNPLAGLKRLVSAQSLWQLAKQALKLGLLAVICYQILIGLGHRLVGARPVDMAPLIAYAGASILGLVRYVAVGGILLAMADYAVQRRRFTKSLKMTKRELKEENRQSQGDPIVKGAMRRQQARMSRSRMMAAVIGADVVVTNPTHVAIALRYDPRDGSAPRLVAKGAEEMAARIREQATRHRVPIVEDPPLARAVYAACEVDEYIPAELYVAVARLLAFVFTLPAGVKAAVPVHHRATSALVA